MKKRFILYLAILLSLPLFLITGCKCNNDEDISVQLFPPSYVEVIENDDNLILYADKNPSADHYLFYICRDEDNKDDLSKYILIANTTNNFIDVTKEFANKQTYYFYAQTTSDKKEFEKSDPSNVYSFTNSLTLSTPIISINNGIISWQQIIYANSYNIILNDNLLTSTSNTSFNILNYNNGSLLNQNLTLSFKVIATSQNSSFHNSKLSNEVIYLDHLIPTVPTFSIENDLLTINRVSISSGYELKTESLNTNTYLIDQFSSSSKSFNLRNFYDKNTNKYIDLLEEVGEYNICIKAINGDYSSNYSNYQKYIVKRQIESPQIVSIKLDDLTNSLNVIIKNNSTISNSLHIDILLANSTISRDIIVSESVIQVMFTLDDLDVTSLSSLKGNKVNVYANSIGSYYLNSNVVSSLI